MDEPVQQEIHALEKEFGLSAHEILSTINRRNRCKIAVRGAIAEEHLKRHLQGLREQGAIEDFEDIDQDGKPDFRVRFSSRSFDMECKNVEKKKKADGSITIDFKRTRDPKAGTGGRYYSPDEFAILAACLWNSTGKWEFVFAATNSLPRHPSYSNRLDDHVTVENRPLLPGMEQIWYTSLPDLLARLVS